MNKTKLSRERFAENYSAAMNQQRLPLVYGRQNYGEVEHSGLHLHEDHYAFYLVNTGRGIHEINGQPYAIARGDIYIAPPGSVHAYSQCENLEVDVFVFTIDLFDENELAALRNLPGFRSLFVADASSEWSTHRLHLAPQRYSEMEGRVREVCREMELMRDEYSAPQKRAIASEILTRSLFFRLLVELARLWQMQNVPREQPSTQSSYRHVELAEVLRFCEAHFREPISVPQLAAKMFLSPSRFAQIWKRETGAPPAEYLRRLRLDAAQRLLKTTAQPLTKIALDCGFTDAAQFSRSFRAAFGMTPSEYRDRFG